MGDCDQDVEDIDEQEFSIKAVHFHPENNVGAYLNNDLAVVRLSSRVSHLLPFPRPGVHHLELGQHGPGQWPLLQETPGRQGAHPGDQALYGETGVRPGLTHLAAPHWLRSTGKSEDWMEGKQTQIFCSVRNNFSQFQPSSRLSCSEYFPTHQGPCGCLQLLQE